MSWVLKYLVWTVLYLQGCLILYLPTIWPSVLTWGLPGRLAGSCYSRVGVCVQAWDAWSPQLNPDLDCTSWHVEPRILLCTTGSSWLLLHVWHPPASLVDMKDTLACAGVPSRVEKDKHCHISGCSMRTENKLCADCRGSVPAPGPGKRGPVHCVWLPQNGHGTLEYIGLVCFSFHLNQGALWASTRFRNRFLCFRERDTPLRITRSLLCFSLQIPLQKSLC